MTEWSSRSESAAPDTGSGDIYHGTEKQDFGAHRMHAHTGILSKGEWRLILSFSPVISLSALSSFISHRFISILHTFLVVTLDSLSSRYCPICLSPCFVFVPFVFDPAYKPQPCLYSYFRTLAFYPALFAFLPSPSVVHVLSALFVSSATFIPPTIQPQVFN